MIPGSGIIRGNESDDNELSSKKDRQTTDT